MNKSKLKNFNDQMIVIGCLKRYFHNFQARLDCKEQLTLTLQQPQIQSFLITGDEVLGKPLVWEWTIHDDQHGSMGEYPLELESCLNWNDDAMHLVDIIGELFCEAKDGIRYERYSVFNPFQIDLAPLTQLEPCAKLRESSRLMEMLETVFGSERLGKLELKLIEDYQRVSNIHFSAYYDIAKKQGPAPEDIKMAEERSRVLKKTSTPCFMQIPRPLAPPAGRMSRRTSLPFSLFSFGTSAASPAALSEDAPARRRVESLGSTTEASSSPSSVSPKSSVSTNSSSSEPFGSSLTRLGSLFRTLSFNGRPPTYSSVAAADAAAAQRNAATRQRVRVVEEET